jgi:hypothetical protein
VGCTLSPSERTSACDKRSKGARLNSAVHLGCVQSVCDPPSLPGSWNSQCPHLSHNRGIKSCPKLAVYSCPGYGMVGPVSKSALRLTQPCVQRPSVDPSPGFKRPRLEADSSSPSSAEVRNTWSLASTVRPQSALFLCVRGIPAFSVAQIM